MATPTFVVRATVAGFGERQQYRIYVPSCGLYLMIGPYAGPYPTRDAAQRVVAELNEKAHRGNIHENATV